ncbi:MAG: hypothetical protein ACI8X5_003696 [Planctomycetota bacterium]|jgi:hypothetical protein
MGDFLYLSFLLIRGMPSVEPVKQAHMIGPFTSNKKVAGSSIAPLGLT